MTHQILGQAAAETLSTPVPGPDVAELRAEVLARVTPQAELAALVHEYVASVQPQAEVAQAVAELLTTVQPSAEVAHLLLEALTTRDPSLRAEAIQVSGLLVEMLRNNASAGASVQRDVFAFRHNWAEPLVERLEWQARVARTVSGHERREANRSHPRRSITYRVGSGRSFDALAADWLSEHLGKPAWWPLPQYAAHLSRAAEAGAPVLQAPGINARHFGPPSAQLLLDAAGVQGWIGPERYALLIGVSGWRVLRIQSIVGDTVHLAEPLPGDAAAGSSLMPLLWGRASESVNFTQLLPGMASGSVTALLDPAPEPEGQPADALLDGIPVWPDGNWSSDPGATVAASVTQHDLSPAQPWLRRDDPWTLSTLQRRYLAASSAAIEAWRARLWRAQGRLHPFWLPDGLAPVLRLTHDYAVEDGWLSVDLPHPAAALWQRSAACLILLPNGQRRHALTGPMQAESEGGAALTLRSLLQESIPAGSRVIRLQRCRLDHDAVDLHWHTPHLVEIALTARQLPETPNPAALAWPVVVAAPPPLPSGIPLRAPPRPPQFQCPPPPRAMRRVVLRGDFPGLVVSGSGAGNWESVVGNEFWWMPPDGVTELFITACGAGGRGGLSGRAGLGWREPNFYVSGGSGGGGGGESESVIRHPFTIYPGQHVVCVVPALVQFEGQGSTIIRTGVAALPESRLEVKPGKWGANGRPGFGGADNPTPGGSIYAQPGMPRIGAEGGKGGDGAPSPFAGTEFADASVALGGSGDSRSFITWAGRHEAAVGFPSGRATMPGAGGGGAGGSRVDLNLDQIWGTGRPVIAAPVGMLPTDFSGQNHPRPDSFLDHAHGSETIGHPVINQGGPALLVIEWYDPEPSP